MASPDNLRRLLDPKSIAFVGGNDAEIGLRQCIEMFNGPVYAVNPRRKTMAGIACHSSVKQLPEAPDAVFLATPRNAALESVKALASIGAGGIACFTAGFAELGNEGRNAERKLVEACADMALVGPNCYGLINYGCGAILWPFGAGRQRCERGVALVMQSGMLPANLTMNDRSVPISFVVSAGNQAALAIEDYMDVLIDDERVTAIGVYIEGVRSISRFSAVAIKALDHGKPLVVLKAGRSEVGSALAVSHTGSLAGSDQAFETFFEDYGVIRVDSPVTMMETLKLLSVSGAPNGRRIAAFTCSGGDAAMVADYCGGVDLDLPPPGSKESTTLATLLPDIATISNPLDYTIPVWGNREVMPKVFGAMLDGDYDAAVVIQDFPPAHIHADNSLYRNDALSFTEAVKARNIPGMVCSDLPENLDPKTRELLIAGGITPLQGLDAGLDALSFACDYGLRRAHIIERARLKPFTPVSSRAPSTGTRVINEWEGKRRLGEFGIDVPRHRLCSFQDAVDAAIEIGYPVVVKAAVNNLAHKTEAGAVELNVTNGEDLAAALERIRLSISNHEQNIVLENVLIEEMVEQSLAELLVGVTTDVQFGQLLVIGSGGIFVELLGDTVTLLQPVESLEIEAALRRLKIWPLLAGYRGKAACDVEQLVSTITAISRFCQDQRDSLVELDINPLMVGSGRVVAADVLIREAY